jgi:hypothetical protein
MLLELQHLCLQAVVAIGERLMNSKPNFCSGAAKQFASIMGVAFSGTAALLLFLAPEHGRGFKWAGLAVVLGLAGAIFFNGFINYCFGCTFFSLGVRHGIFPRTMYSTSIASKADMKWTWADVNKRVAEGVPQKGTR